MQVTNRFFVESGYDSDTLEGGGGSNTLQLRRAGWHGLLLDLQHQNASINLHAGEITRAFPFPSRTGSTPAPHDDPNPTATDCMFPRLPSEQRPTSLPSCAATRCRTNLIS